MKVSIILLMAAVMITGVFGSPVLNDVSDNNNNNHVHIAGAVGETSSSTSSELKARAANEIFCDEGRLHGGTLRCCLDFAWRDDEGGAEGQICKTIAPNDLKNNLKGLLAKCPQFLTKGSFWPNLDKIGCCQDLQESPDFRSARIPYCKFFTGVNSRTSVPFWGAKPWTPQ